MNAVGILHKPKGVVPVGDGSQKHERCYLNFLGGCSTKISREHLITASISSRIEVVEPKFPRWKIRSDGVQLDNPYALADVAKVLCTHHNSALGSLFDPVGLVVYDATQRALRDVEPTSTLVNGHDLEGFVTQRLCAHHFGGLLSANGETLRDYEISPQLLQAAFAGMDFPPNCGLFVGPAPDFAAQHGTEIAAMVAPQLKQITGGRVSLGPIGLHVSIIEFDNSKDGVLRPRAIEILSGSGRKHQILLSWDKRIRRGDTAIWDYRATGQRT